MSSLPKSKRRAAAKVGVATPPNLPVVPEAARGHNLMPVMVATDEVVLAPPLATARGPGLVERVAKELGVWRRRKP